MHQIIEWMDAAEIQETLRPGCVTIVKRAAAIYSVKIQPEFQGRSDTQAPRVSSRTLMPALMTKGSPPCSKSPPNPQEPSRFGAACCLESSLNWSEALFQRQLLARETADV